MLDNLVPLGTMALFGLTGSLHCGAMCSSLVACTKNKTSQYFITRSLSYTILGFIAGFIGLGFFKNFLQLSGQSLAILIAVICFFQVIAIIFPKLFLFSNNNKAISQLTHWIMKNSPLSRSATLGIITAILPCGFLYGALLLSVSFANPFISGASMLVFSLVTAPALIFTKGLLSLFSQKFYNLRKVVFVFLLVVTAGFALMRGGVFEKKNALNDVTMCHGHL